MPAIQTTGDYATAHLASGSVTVSKAFASDVTAGSTIVVAVGVHIAGDDFSNQAHSPVVTDSQGNIYTRATWVDSSYLSGGSAGIFITHGVSAGPLTVTFTHTATGSLSSDRVSILQIAEYVAFVPVPQDASSAQVYGAAGDSPVSVSFRDTFSSTISITFGGTSGSGGPGTDTSFAVVDYKQDGGLSNRLWAVCMNAAASTPSTPTIAAGGYTSFSLVGSTSSGGGPTLYLWGDSAGLAPKAWLIIGDPDTGYTDHSSKLRESNPSSFHLTRGDRGTASVTMFVSAADSYAPVTGARVLLYEERAGSDFIRYFAGTIDTVKLNWDAVLGDRTYALDCVSFEQCFDTLFCVSKTYPAGTKSGTIFRDILATKCSGVPVGEGIIDDGFTLIEDLVIVNQRVSEAFANLCGLSEFIWYCDPSNLTVNFHNPTVVPAPITLVASDTLWGSLEWAQTREDYRNKEIRQISADAFANSAELFHGDGSTQNFTLRNSPDEIVNAWITHNTQNTATGTFTGLPTDGDTVTIGYPTSGSQYVWAATTAYALGAIIVDRSGNIQKVTLAGTSGSSYPPFNGALGSTTTDTSVIWTDQGPSGGSIFNASTYTFVDEIDNREFGQVLIGATASETAQNFVYALNADESTRGVNYSLPTWENPVVNADAPSAGAFTIRNKNAGQGYVAALTATAANLAWSDSLTSGGITTFNTYKLDCAVEGSSNTANLYWAKGRSFVKLASVPKGGPSLPLSSAWYLQVEYRRIGGDTIAVEDTAAVLARSILEGGTGRYEQKNDDTSNTSAANALVEAQTSLALFGVLPVSFSFGTDVAGLLPGQQLAITLTGAPVGAADLIDGNWLVQEVQGDIVPGVYFLRAEGGHFRYTIKVINAKIVGTDIALWQKFVGGGSSGGGSSSGGSLGGVLAGTASSTTELTTKGDILGFSTLPVRVPIGADGLVPTADSSKAAGWDWEAAPGSGTWIEETPAGTMNGVNLVFTISHSPMAGTFNLHQNGVRPQSPRWYSISGTTLTYVVAPKTSDFHKVTYEY